MTRWLDPQEQETWRAWVSSAVAILDRLDADLRDRGLSHADYEILAHLSEAPGSALRMSALAEVVLISKSRLSYRVDRLEERGWVKRHSCDDDARGVWASLTAAGRRVIGSEAPRHVALVRELLIDHLRPGTQQALRKDLGAVIEGLGIGHPAHHPA